MKKKIIFMVWFLIGVCACVSFGAESVIDQSQEGGTGWLSYTPDYMHGQSFTPSMPYLTGIEMYGYPGQSASGGNYTVEIWLHNYTGDLYDDPRSGAAPIASATITSMDTSSSNWIRWDFASPVDISDYIGISESLLIMWTTDSAAVATLYHNANPYGSGRRYYLTSGGTAWTQYNNDDMAFRTYGYGEVNSPPGILDQSVESGATGWWSYGPGYFCAQSFTPKLPVLAAVEGYFYPNSDVNGTFTCEIWEQNPAIPTNTTDPRIGTSLLGSATITRIVTGAQPNCWARWDFDPPIDVSSYLGQAQLLIFWKTGPESGPAMPYNGNDPYNGGNFFYVTNDDAPPATGWTRYIARDFYFRTYGLHGTEPCGGWETVYKTADINKDCNVDMEDFSELATDWKNCSNPADPNCDQYWKP